MGGISAVGKMI